jgi:hypothetical protein|tara:strand:- start:625 stop:1047 length:423 start_codon:yes stop_codon:yes gene_type:complete
MSKIFAQLDENKVVINILECDDDETYKTISTKTKSDCVEADKGVAKGYTWQPENNRFIGRQPYDDWTLNDETGKWECPVAEPSSSNYTDSEGVTTDLKPWLLDWNPDLNRWECMSPSLSEEQIPSNFYWNPSNSTWNLIS